MSRVKYVAVHPVLPVKDVQKAIEYYVEKLGFDELFKDSEAAPKYAGVGRDKVELHLQWHDPVEFDNVEKLNLRFVIIDIEELFEEYKKQNIFHGQTALRDTEWGTREFAFFDLDNNGLTFYCDL